MTTEPSAPTPDDCEDLAQQVAARLLEVRREARRRFWSRVGYLLMLLGAASGLVTPLAAIWDWLG
jgi:hypothetical protein